MTPRERVLAALSHRQPDKTAIDFGGRRSSGIAAMAYRILRQALGFVFQQVHNILADVPPENIIAMFDAANEKE